MKQDNRSLVGKRIGVFGKGGSGKSTVSVLLSQALQEAGYHVCLVDADSTNVGLAQALGFNEHPVSLIDHFGGMIFSGGLVTCPVDDPMPLEGAEITPNDLQPRYFLEKDELTLFEAGKIGSLGPGAGCDGPVSKIVRDLRITGYDLPTVTLNDFKAGFEDTARGVVTGLDLVIVVVDPTTAAIEMAVNMRDMIDQIKSHVLPATNHLESPELVAWANRIFTEATIQGYFVILNRVQNADIETFLRRQLADRGIDPIGIIHEDQSVINSWLKGTPIEAEELLVEAQRIVFRLENAVNQVARGSQ